MQSRTRIYRLAELSHGRLLEFDRARTAVFASVGPLEVHGPHLPLGQDLMQAERLLEAALELVAAERPEWSFIVAPELALGCDLAPHLGSVPFPPELIRDAAYGCLRPFAEAGFARLGFSGFHGGPRHIVAVEDAAHRLSRFPGVAAASLFSMALEVMGDGNIFFEALDGDEEFELTLDQLNRDWHAGFVETSLGLHLWPELVDAGWSGLEDLDKESNYGTAGSGAQGRDLFAALNRAAALVRSFRQSVDYYKTRTYEGRPASASASLGRKMFERLARVSADLLREFLDRGLEMEDLHYSLLWKHKDILLNPAVNRILGRLGVFD